VEHPYAIAYVYSLDTEEPSAHLLVDDGELLTYATQAEAEEAAKALALDMPVRAWASTGYPDTIQIARIEGSSNPVEWEPVSAYRFPWGDSAPMLLSLARYQGQTRHTRAATCSDGADGWELPHYTDREHATPIDY
jgi:hypothetical protein